MRETKLTIVFDKDDPRTAVVGWGRIGHRYVYFREDGRDHEGKYRLDKVFVFIGWREDIVKAVEEYDRQVREYHRRRETFQNELERQLIHLRMEKLKQWSEENPRPVLDLSKFVVGIERWGAENV
jgi:hypothetical protein